MAPTPKNPRSVVDVDLTVTCATCWEEVSSAGAQEACGHGGAWHRKCERTSSWRYCPNHRRHQILSGATRDEMRGREGVR